MGTGAGPRGLEPGSGRRYLGQAPSASWNREPEGPRQDRHSTLQSLTAVSGTLPASKGRHVWHQHAGLTTPGRKVPLPPTVTGTPSGSVQSHIHQDRGPGPSFTPDSPSPSFPTACLGFSLQALSGGSERRTGGRCRSPVTSRGRPKGSGGYRFAWRWGGSHQAFHNPRSSPPQSPEPSDPGGWAGL